MYLSLRLFVFLAALVVVLPGCSEVECQFNSQCGEGFYCIGGFCRQDCQVDTDCADGRVCNSIGECVPPGDASRPIPDGSPPPPPPPMDSSLPDSAPPPPPPPMDASRPDGPVTGPRGAYLDRCTDASGCSAGLDCVADVGGTRFCSRPCSAHSGCAQEHVCAPSGFCAPDDTGSPCTSAASSECNLGLCVAFSTTGTGSCTRDCTSSADCPAGYGCTNIGGSQVCVDIELGCASAGECLTGSCLSAQGCTSTCRTPADCPATHPLLSAYRCEAAFGSATPICVPPGEVTGSQPIGASCIPSSANNCRSGICNGSETSGPMCTQVCTSQGGCGPGLGCFPQVEGGSIEMICVRAGTRDMGQPCARAMDCHSGLCDGTSSQCTRLCNDGICPTGWRCEAVAGFGLAICRPA